MKGFEVVYASDVCSDVYHSQGRAARKGGEVQPSLAPL